MAPIGGANLAVTYANDRNTDGAGAQLLRVYGIYAISRALGIPYIHSPLTRIGYQGLPALERNCDSTEVESEYNRVFRIPSDMELPERRTVYEMTDADLELIKEIRSAAQHDGEFHLIRILYPYPITGQNPELYGPLKEISPFPYAGSDVFRLVIHVRRGELYVVDSDRMLPNSYYVSCALQIAHNLRKLGIPFVCELHTEVPSKTFEVTPQHHGICGRIPGNITLHPETNRIEDFDVVPNLEKFINSDPIDALRRMSTADALVISRSCFSFLPALLNGRGIIVYHPCDYRPLKDWLIANDYGLAPNTKLVARLEAWKRQRSAP